MALEAPGVVQVGPHFFGAWSEAAWCRGIAFIGHANLSSVSTSRKRRGPQNGISFARFA